MNSKVRIVNLDAYPANPGDLSWRALEEAGEFISYESCPNNPDEVVRRCAGAEIVLTNKIIMNKEIMDRLPELKYIVVQATGYNIVDTAYARSRGIAVSNVPSYSTYSVAQLVFAMLLELTAQVKVQDKAVHDGCWSASPVFTYFACRMTELAGHTLGIYGFGTIGQTVGRIGAALGMRIIYYSRTRKQCDFAQYVPAERLFADSDILTLHCPQTPETAKIINRQTLNHMKPSALLINTARGGLVDSAALADALNADRLAGAGIDVLEQEPPPKDHPLLHAKNCLLTPHIGWATFEARQRLISVIAENVQAYLNGVPIHMVN